MNDNPPRQEQAPLNADALRIASDVAILDAAANQNLDAAGAGDQLANIAAPTELAATSEPAPSEDNTTATPGLPDVPSGSNNIKQDVGATDGPEDKTEFKCKYDENNQLQSSAYYKNGVLHGEECQYQGGMLAQRTQYKDGLIHGVMETYSEQQLSALMYYKGGKPEGIFMQYAPSGYPAYRACMRGGVLDGTAIVYDDEGAVSQIQTYKRGNLHGPSITYYPSGTPFEYGAYQDGQKHGEFTQYNPDYKINKVITYQYGAKIEEEDIES